MNVADSEVALGIDLGTGSTKAGLISHDGQLLAVGRASHAIEEPQRGWSETDPDRWMAGVTAAVADVLASGPACRVVAVGLSGQMHGVVLCGDRIQPLRPAVLWSDRRAEPYLADLRRDLDAAIDGDALAALANPVVAGMAGPTLASLTRDEPDTMRRTVVALQPKDWLRYQLTGELATDPSDASATLLWDAGTDRWSDEACAAFGVAKSTLAPVRPSAASGGALRPEAAELLGLPPGVPVAIGAADTAAALLGANIGIGETQVSTGTGGQIAQPCDAMQVDRTGRTHLFRAAGLDAAGPPRWYAMAAMQNVGIAIDWAMSLLDASPDEITAAMIGVAPSPSPGAPGARAPRAATGPVFLPYLTGERTPHMDPSLTGGWNNLRPTTGRADLIRSVFTGVAATMADGKSALVDAGYRIDGALLAGGGSVAPWWRQLLANTLGVPLTPHDATEASVRGAGLLGWAAAGHLVDAAVSLTRADPIHPQPSIRQDPPVHQG